MPNQQANQNEIFYLFLRQPPSTPHLFMWKLVAAQTGWPDAAPPELTINFPEDSDSLVVGMLLLFFLSSSFPHHQENHTHHPRSSH